MPSSDERQDLRPDDQRFVQRVADHYTPHPLSATRQATFDGRLSERLADSARLPFLWPASLLAATCAVLLWFALPSQQVSDPNFKDLTLQSASTPLAQDTGTANTQDITSHTSLLAYAYYQSEAQTDFLPAEYLALADAFELL